MPMKHKNLETGIVEIVDEPLSADTLQMMEYEQALQAKIREEEKDTPIMKAFEKIIKKNFKKHKRGNLNTTLTLNDVFAQMLAEYPELGGE